MRPLTFGSLVCSTKVTSFIDSYHLQSIYRLFAIYLSCLAPQGEIHRVRTRQSLCDGCISLSDGDAFVFVLNHGFSSSLAGLTGVCHTPVRSSTASISEVFQYSYGLQIFLSGLFPFLFCRRRLALRIQVVVQHCVTLLHNLPPNLILSIMRVEDEMPV